MKKLFLIMICLLIAFSASPSSAVTFHNDKTPTLSWQMVTTDIDGEPISGIVTYQLWLANADTDPNKANPVMVSETTGLETTITLIKGRFFVGVQAWLGDLNSGINWGDIIDNQEGVALIGLRWAVPPHAPKKLIK